MKRSFQGFSIAVILSIVLLLPVVLAEGVDCPAESWVEAKPAQVPGVRICGMMVYDSESDIVLQYGGFNGAEGTGEMWAYDYETNTWENMTPLINPAPRYGQGFIYDESRDRCIMFFGTDVGGVYYNDTWIYDYKENTWAEVEYTGPAAQRRHCFQVALDRESGVIVVQGGITPGLENSEDTWIPNPYPEEEDSSATIMTIIIILTIIVVLIAIIGIVLIRSSKAD